MRVSNDAEHRQRRETSAHRHTTTGATIREMAVLRSEREIHPVCGPNSEGFSMAHTSPKSDGFISKNIIEESWVGFLGVYKVRGTFLGENTVILAHASRSHNTFERKIIFSEDDVDETMRESSAQ